MNARGRPLVAPTTLLILKLYVLTKRVILSEENRKAIFEAEVLERERNATRLRAEPKPTRTARGLGEAGIYERLLLSFRGECYFL